MKKMFYILVAGLSFELEASEVKDPLQEISKEEDRHMSEVSALQTERIEQSEINEAGKKETTGEKKYGYYYVLDPVWVTSGYERHDGTWPFGSDVWIDTSHWETGYRYVYGEIPSTEVATLKAIDEKSGEKNSIVEEK